MASFSEHPMNVVEGLYWAWSTFAIAWASMKDLAEIKGSVDNIMYHVVAGLLIFGTALVVDKRSRRWATAWALTFAFALVNELVDITIERWPNLNEQLIEGAFDLAVTMALPTLALAIWATISSRSLASN